MKPIKYSLILFLMGVLFPVLAQAYQEGDLDLDYYLYKERKGQQTAMAYVADLNQRIEKCSQEQNRQAFKYLTNILTNVLTTGGPFGIRSTGPTPDELKELNVSFQHLARRAVTWSTPKQDKTETLRILVNDTAQYNGWNKSPFTKSQADAVTKHVLAALKTVDQKPLDYKNWETDDWFRFASDGKVIIRDLRKGYEFYLLKTDPDGACWMHAMACSNSPEFTGKRFIKKLLSLDEKERKAVCEFAAVFFTKTLFVDKEYQTLLQGNQPLLQKAGNLATLFQNKTYTDLSSENQSRVVDFISQEPVFRALVERKEEGNQDTKSLVTSTGGNVWNSMKGFGNEWPEIWAFVYKKNILSLNAGYCLYTKQLLFFSCSDYYKFSGNPWGFFYQGSGNIHLSALWPVGVTPPKDMTMEFANKSYFDEWHTLKKAS